MKNCGICFMRKCSKSKTQGWPGMIRIMEAAKALSCRFSNNRFRCTDQEKWAKGQNLLICSMTQIISADLAYQIQPQPSRSIWSSGRRGRISRSSKLSSWRSKDTNTVYFWQLSMISWRKWKMRSWMSWWQCWGRGSLWGCILRRAWCRRS